MKLRELNLISFGKFKNAIFKLDDGLNILYGGNEAGKTTIHTFIEGMFYGFQKPHVRTRRSFYEERNKYIPWNGDKYAGILIFEKDNKRYRIERDFKEDRFKVYDDLTGKDITDQIDGGQRVKTHLPGLYFFDFNCLVYRNTVAIRQLENKVDGDLAKEVKDKLANITTALDDEISVKKALEELDHELGKIGSEKAPTQPYAQAKKKLDNLIGRQKQALEKKREYDSLYEDLLKLQEDIERAKEEVEEIKGLLEKANMIKIKRTYEEALSIEKAIEDLDNNIKELEAYANIREEDYHKSLELDGKLVALREEIKNLSERINRIDQKLEELNKRKAVENEAYVEEIYEDYSSYNLLEEEKNRLLLEREENKIEILNRELKQAEEKIKRTKMQGLFLGILAILSLGLSLVNNFLLIATIFSAILTMYSIMSKRKMQDELSSLNNNINGLKSKEEERKKRIDQIEKEQENIIRKYKLSSKTEFFMLYEETRFKQASVKDHLRQMDELSTERKDLIRKLEDKKAERQNIEEKLRYLLDSNGLEDLKDFKEALDNKISYDKLKRERENKRELLERILGNTSIEELESKVREIKEDIALDRDVEAIERELREKEEYLSSLNNEHSRLEVKLDTLNTYIKELVDIEEEINRTEAEIKQMDKKKRAINIAKEVILKISEEIHKEFAPRINKDVSQLISSITDGKYTNIKIDENLDISVENPQSKEIISLDNLSGGTIDQMYFALRFSLIKSIKEENLPLILDDCFLQYDSNRLKNILKYLHKVSKSTQILLFTCQEREMEILDGLNLKYNLIKIG
ncbi:MAG: AAA family ATPase [Tissierellia bacterium]|nr:AAA family ATPase [Tissierellia bacterium]